MRAVLRPMVSPGQPPRVLVVSRLASACAPATPGDGVIQARANESGTLSALTAREMEISISAGNRPPTSIRAIPTKADLAR